MGKTVIRVLAIEASPGCARKLPDHGFEVEEVAAFSGGIERASVQHFDLILLDLHLPNSSGLEHLAKIQISSPSTPVIVLVRPGDEKLGRDALHLGAQDFFHC